jgi:AcrR family transcriptional regulator
MMTSRKARAAPSRRTNAEISGETRKRVLSAARKRFAADGFQAASGEEIVAEAGVTRGALYYQFGDMTGLFAAVADEAARELSEELYARTMQALPKQGQSLNSVDEMEIGADLLLRAFATRDVAALLLREAPVVLGHEKWNVLVSGLRGLVDHALGHWVDAKILPARRRDATAQLIFGALIQAGLAISAAGNKTAALSTYREAVRDLILGLRTKR